MKVLPLIKKYKLLIIISIIVILALILGLVFNKQTDGFEDAKYEYEEINNKQPVKPIDQTITGGYKTTDNINKAINEAKTACNSNAECKGFYIGIDRQKRPFYRLLKSTENKKRNPKFSMNKMFIKKEIKDVKDKKIPSNKDELSSLITNLENRNNIKKVLEIKKNNNKIDNSNTLYFFKFINNNDKELIAKYNNDDNYLVVGGNRYTTDNNLDLVYPTIKKNKPKQISNLITSLIKPKANQTSDKIIKKTKNTPERKQKTDNAVLRELRALKEQNAKLSKQLEQLKKKKANRCNKNLIIAQKKLDTLNNQISAKNNRITQVESENKRLKGDLSQAEKKSFSERQQTNTSSAKNLGSFDVNVKKAESFVDCSYSPANITEYFDDGEETPLDLLSSYFDQRAIPIINEGSSVIDVTDYLTRAQVEKCYKKCLI